jgi:hypothetical protein
MASAVASYESGFPLTISQGLNNMNLLSGTQRPSIVAGVNPLLTDDPENAYDPTCGCIRWLNPAAWSQAAPFTLGNAPRTDGRVRTAAHRNVDLAIQKSGAIGRQTLSVRAELINVFNFADLRGPSMSFGDASFGQIREAGGFPRMLQVVVRTSWY